jgi:hypothetical protein
MPEPQIIHCPRCSGAMSVTDEYLAAYGGQTTTCPMCQQPFTLPAINAAAPLGAAPVIAYANPYTNTAPAGLFDDGTGLVMYKGSIGPDRCVKCNAPAEGYQWRKTFYWHHPAFYFMILFPGLLIYAIVALCIRKSGRISIGLCPVHRATRRRHIWIAWGIFFLSLAFFIGGPYLGSGKPHGEADTYILTGVLGGIVLLLASLIYGAVAVPVVAPRRIDDHYVYLSRAGEPFLATLPKVR